MSDNEKIAGVIAVIDDGIKDAQMQMDWACAAKDDGDREAAAMFQNEAMKRLTGAREWCDKCREMMEDPGNAETVAKVFVRRMDEKLSYTIARVKDFIA